MFKSQRKKKIHFGKKVWCGAGFSVRPGITAGDTAISGAAPGETKDFPANVIAVGSPAKVLRQITEEDDRMEGGKPIPQEMLDKYV